MRYTGFPYDETPTGFFYFTSEEGADNGFGRDIYRAEKEIASRQKEDVGSQDDAVFDAFVVLSANLLKYFNSCSGKRLGWKIFIKSFKTRSGWKGKSS